MNLLYFLGIRNNPYSFFFLLSLFFLVSSPIPLAIAMGNQNPGLSRNWARCRIIASRSVTPMPSNVHKETVAVPLRPKEYHPSPETAMSILLTSQLSPDTSMRLSVQWPNSLTRSGPIGGYSNSIWISMIQSAYNDGKLHLHMNWTKLKIECLFIQSTLKHVLFFN